MSDVAVIVDAVEPVVSALGLELYDVEVSGSGRATVVRVLVDRAGGIDLDAVGAASQAISPVLDSDRVARALPGPYALEVSSPGLERPLRKPEHYRRVVGATVSVKTPGRRTRGVVVEADDEGFALALDDGSQERISYTDVVQARTVFEWGAKKAARR
ncbi:MAG: ribosome maturation factor RimP [Acidimicrobiia bacterium]